MVDSMVVVMVDGSGVLSFGAGEDVGNILPNMLCVVVDTMVKRTARHQRLYRNIHKMVIVN